MKSITVKETKTVKVLTNLSYLLSEDFKEPWEVYTNLRYDDIEKILKEKECKILCQCLNIPIICGLKTHRDTSILVDGRIFYTCSDFIQDKEIVTEEKELFIPNFNNLDMHACNHFAHPKKVIKKLRCWAANCSDCIMYKDNFKYLK